MYDLRAKYDFYNRLLFDGKLPDIPLIWKPLKGVGGKAVATLAVATRPAPNPVLVRLGRVDKYAHRDIVPGTMRIEMSDIYKRSEQGLDGLLVHEMLHIYFMSNNMAGESHGSNFLAELRRCEKIVNFKIPLTDKVADLEFSREMPVKTIGVILIERPTGPVVSLFSEAVMKNNFDEIKVFMEKRASATQQVFAYLIADQLWTQDSIKKVVQRKFHPYSYKLFKTTPDLVADLHQNGKLLASYR